MKLRASMIWSVVIIAVLIALVFWFWNRRPAEAPVASSIETNVAPFGTTTPGQRLSTSAHTATSPAQVAANAGAPPMIDKGQQIKEGLGSMNDVPIVFYGRLRDQFDNPVVGAEIATSIRIYNGVRSTVEHSSVTSDANGFFQVNGGKGESLGLWPKKEGYTLAATGTEFKYSYMYAGHFTPDQNNPTVIKMWKLQGAEPLVGIYQNYKIHYISAPINFDLVTGKIVPTGGDVRITVNRPVGDISEHNPQDWGFEIEAVDGGLIETSGKEEAVTFAAPENGYQPSDSFTASGNRHGIGIIQQAFFVQSRNGQVYSKLGLSFGINEKPDGFMSIIFSGVANTNSSRNWEATAPQ